METRDCFGLRVFFCQATIKQEPIGVSDVYSHDQKHAHNSAVTVRTSTQHGAALTAFSLSQTCCVKVEGKAPSARETSENKRIMLVSDFYYGRFEGDGSVKVQKTNTTFKCQSCLKILKNNIRSEVMFSRRLLI